MAKKETKKVVKKSASEKAVKVAAAPKAKATAKKVVAKAQPKKTTEIVASGISKKCKDKNCPHCAGLKTHGRVFEGVVVSDKMQGTVTVQWPRQRYVPKYERYYKTRSKIKAHNSPCVAAKTGDKVRIAECRPISKTVNFVVVEALNG